MEASSDLGRWACVTLGLPTCLPRKGEPVIRAVLVTVGVMPSRDMTDQSMSESSSQDGRSWRSGLPDKWEKPPEKAYTRPPTKQLCVP